MEYPWFFVCLSFVPPFVCILPPCEKQQKKARVQVDKIYTKAVYPGAYFKPFQRFVAVWFFYLNGCTKEKYFYDSFCAKRRLVWGSHAGARLKNFFWVNSEPKTFAHFSFHTPEVIIVTLQSQKFLLNLNINVCTNRGNSKAFFLAFRNSGK